MLVIACITNTHMGKHRCVFFTSAIKWGSLCFTPTQRAALASHWLTLFPLNTHTDTSVCCWNAFSLKWLNCTWHAAGIHHMVLKVFLTAEQGKFWKRDHNMSVNCVNYTQNWYLSYVWVVKSKDGNYRDSPAWLNCCYDEVIHEEKCI